MRSLTIIALLLAAYSWSQNLSQRQGVVSQAKQDQSRGTQQPVAQDQRGTEAVPLVIKQLPAPKTNDESAQEAKDRAEKAANDRKLVEFTGSLVTATWVLGAIGILQLLVFSYQAYQLRVTVNAAAEQSESMERSITEANRLASAMENVAKDIAISATAATESVVAVRERTAQQMRAYLCVIVGAGIYQDRAKNLKFQATPLVVNAGHTPAHKVAFRASAAILPLPLPDDFAFPLPVAAIGGSVVGPQQSITLSPMVEDFCDDADVEKIKHAEGKALYAWGIVTYEDVFGEPHQTKFCQILTWLPDGKVWGYYTDHHNDAT
jgi:hypothetical protein